MWNAAQSGYYWTTDPFAYIAFQLAVSGSSIYTPSDASLSFESDRWNRQSAAVRPVINGNPDNWLMLTPSYPNSVTSSIGNFPTGTCLNNPSSSLCQTRGMSVCFWIKLNAATVTLPGVLLNSGGSDYYLAAMNPDRSTGFNFLQSTDGQVFSVSTQSQLWLQFVKNLLIPTGTRLHGLATPSINATAHNDTVHGRCLKGIRLQDVKKAYE